MHIAGGTEGIGRDDFVSLSRVFGATNLRAGLQRCSKNFIQAGQLVIGQSACFGEDRTMVWHQKFGSKTLILTFFLNEGKNASN